MLCSYSFIFSLLLSVLIDQLCLKAQKFFSLI
jgi:hypothetical protein